MRSNRRAAGAPLTVISPGQRLHGTEDGTAAAFAWRGAGCFSVDAIGLVVLSVSVHAFRLGQSRLARWVRAEAPALAYRRRALHDGLIKRNPCRIKGAGTEDSPERPVLTVMQVYALAEAIDPRYRALIMLATFASLRWAELTAQTSQDIDLVGQSPVGLRCSPLTVETSVLVIRAMAGCPLCARSWPGQARHGRLAG